MKRKPVEYTTVNPTYAEGSKMWKIVSCLFVVIVLTVIFA